MSATEGERCLDCGAIVQDGDDIDHVIERDCEVRQLSNEIERLRQEVKGAKGDLIFIAAQLLDAKWASDDPGDWPLRPSGPVVAAKIAHDSERRRRMAVNLRLIADGLDTAGAGGESDKCKAQREE